MIKCQKSIISIIDKDILFINIGSKEEFSLLDYKEVRLASIKLLRNKAVFNLIDLGNTIPSSEVREASAKNCKKSCIRAEAIVVHSLGQRIVARDILKVKKKSIPAELFTTINEAMDWLNTIRLQERN